MCVKIVFFCLAGEDIYSMYYAYEHYKKDTDQIFYVGIGKIEEGKYQRAYSLAKRNPHWHATAKKYGFDSKIVFESESREEVCNKEIELILKYGRKDLGTGPLVNKTTGGEKTFKMSKDTILKILETKRKNGAMEIISQRARERMLTNNPWKGKTHDGFNKKKIFQYDALNGNFIQVWDSIRKAINYYQCNPKTISWALSGKRKAGLNFIWSYEYLGENVGSKKNWENGDSKKIIELNEDGKVLNEWGSITKASEDFSCSSWMFSYYLKRNQKIDNRIVKIKNPPNNRGVSKDID